MTERVWVLGAEDPEMAAIEQLLTYVGEYVTHAASGGRRVRQHDAYAADGVSRPIDRPHVYLVECGGPAFEHIGATTVTVVDHHRPGDPGYGLPPADYWQASSLGQVYERLLELGVLGADDWDDDYAAIAAADHLAAVPDRGEIS